MKTRLGSLEFGKSHGRPISLHDNIIYYNESYYHLYNINLNLFIRKAPISIIYFSFVLKTFLTLFNNYVTLYVVLT